MIKSYKHEKTLFTKEELACNCCGRAKLDPHFKSHLRALRLMWNKPMIMNSVCRCTAHNQKIGGHIRSLHLMNNKAHPTLGSLAGDVSTRNMSPDEIEDFVSLAMDLGWSVGIANSFIHIDRRVDIGLKQTKYYYGKPS